MFCGYYILYFMMFLSKYTMGFFFTERCVAYNCAPKIVVAQTCRKLCSFEQNEIATNQKEETTINQVDCVTDAIDNSLQPTLRFSIHGEPLPLLRHRATRRGIMYNPSAKAQQLFQSACLPHMPTIPLSGPLEAKLIFHFSRPKNHFGSGKNTGKLKAGQSKWCSKKPDLDNLAKFVLDALNKQAFFDDSQIALLTTAKLYTEKEPYTEVIIRPLNNDIIPILNE